MRTLNEEIDHWAARYKEKPTFELLSILHGVIWRKTDSFRRGLTPEEEMAEQERDRARADEMIQIERPPA